jgi:hypothetical protein
MTQKQIEQTRVIALYDKWLVIPEGTYSECHRQTIWFGHGGRHDCYHDITAVSDLPYLTDLNALHKVIKQIRSEFRENHPPLDNAVEMYKQLGNALYDAFDSDSYEDLFNAVYEGIVYLNSTK